MRKEKKYNFLVKRDDCDTPVRLSIRSWNKDAYIAALLNLRDDLTEEIKLYIGEEGIEEWTKI